MADPRLNITDYLTQLHYCQYTYVYHVYDVNNNLTESYYAPHGVTINGTCLLIKRAYDVNGNMTLEKKVFGVWTAGMQAAIDAL